MADSDASSMIYYSPSPGAYAVIRLNPVEMVRHLQDQDALAQARAMRTRTYLIYLHREMALPFPDQPWYRFEILPIAPCLRPSDDARGITPDMCVPIYPNTSHPSGRTPLHPEPEGLFPYNNCYSWFETKATVRVRSRPEEFDETHAVTLPPMGRVKLKQAFIECGLQMGENKQAMTRSTAPDVGAPLAMQAPHPLAPPMDVPISTRHRRASVASSSSSNSSFAMNIQPRSSLEDLAIMDIFSGPNDDVGLVPLVDLWISELEDHLRQEDIPSPLEMFAEFAEIARIVQEARIRSYAAMMAPALHDVDHDADVFRTPTESKPKRFRPIKAWTKLCINAKRLSLRLVRATCLLAVRF
ncbi:hypothetical protein C8Q70DRAFT_215546 [Cubamyces menziesii]|nr:hypothetical protein C8Q70DRAFT_215546 [Cubamyces menziesii]